MKNSRQSWFRRYRAVYCYWDFCFVSAQRSDDSGGGGDGGEVAVKRPFGRGETENFLRRDVTGVYLRSQTWRIKIFEPLFPLLSH